MIYAALTAASYFLVASISEDALGVTCLQGSLGQALNSMLRCLVALESHDPKKGTLQARLAGGALPVAGAAGAAVGVGRVGIVRPAAAPSGRARAAGLQRAAAIESALARAIYLLVRTYGAAAVLASGIEDEPGRMPKLSTFLSEVA